MTAMRSAKFKVRNLRGQTSCFSQQANFKEREEREREKKKGSRETVDLKLKRHLNQMHPVSKL